MASHSPGGAYVQAERSCRPHTGACTATRSVRTSSNAAIGCPSIFGKTEVFVLETSLYAFLDDIPLLREVIQFMAERGYEIYDVAGQIRRPIDGALGQLDIAFARRNGFLRQHDLW